MLAESSGLSLAGGQSSLRLLIIDYCHDFSPPGSRLDLGEVAVKKTHTRTKFLTSRCSHSQGGGGLQVKKSMNVNEETENKEGQWRWAAGAHKHTL